MNGPIFVDTNVIVDIASRDRHWYKWSLEQVSRFDGDLVINPVVYAEIAGSYETKENLDELLAGFRREDIPWDAAFLAGRAHVAYRQRGGIREAILSDFLIGAHALVRGYPLLTRDSRRYRYAFPGLALIAPEAR